MKVALSLSSAESIARSLREVLAISGLFSRIEIAGSVRRKKPLVGDIELVALGAEGKDFQREQLTREILSEAGIERAPPTGRGTPGTPSWTAVASPFGPRYYKGVMLVDAGPVQVDLFVVLPPADWGVNYLIRTGSREFSQAFVTRLHRWGLQSHDGHVTRMSDGFHIQCSTEDSFFRVNRMEYVPPEHREPGDPVSTKAFAGET